MGKQGDLRALQKRELIFCALALFLIALQTGNHLPLLDDPGLSLRNPPVRCYPGQFANEPISVGQMQGLDFQELRQHPASLAEKLFVALMAFQPRDKRPLARDAELASSNVSFGCLKITLDNFWHGFFAGGAEISPVENNSLAETDVPFPEY